MTIEAMKQWREALKEYCEHGAIFMPLTALKSIDQAIAKAEKQEPVVEGSIHHLKVMMEESAWEGRLELSDVLANIDEFYTHPQQKREPLTDEQIENIWYDQTGLSYFANVAEFVRAIEAAHGIKE